MPRKNNDEDRCLPSLWAAWHGMHRLGAALVSGGTHSVLLGQGPWAAWLSSPPQGLAPHPLVTTLSTEAHHPPAGLTCGLLAHPLRAPISSIWSQHLVAASLLAGHPNSNQNFIPHLKGESTVRSFSNKRLQRPFSPPQLLPSTVAYLPSPLPLAFALQPSPRGPTRHITSGEKEESPARQLRYITSRAGGSQSQHLQGKPPPWLYERALLCPLVLIGDQRARLRGHSSEKKL